MPSGLGRALWGGLCVLAALAHTFPLSRLDAAYTRPADVVETQATVVSADVTRRVSGGRRSTVTHRCVVRAYYQAGGLRHTMTATVSRESRSDADRACAEFEPGLQHQAFYARSDPSNASLLPGTFGTPIQTTVMLLLGPLGVWLVGSGVRQGRRYVRRYGSLRPL